MLDGLRVALRQHDLVPIVIEFERPADRDYTEAVPALAGMSCFVISDLTSPQPNPLERLSMIPGKDDLIGVVQAAIIDRAMALHRVLAEH